MLQELYYLKKKSRVLLNSCVQCKIPGIFDPGFLFLPHQQHGELLEKSPYWGKNSLRLGIFHGMQPSVSPNLIFVELLHSIMQFQGSEFWETSILSLSS